MLLLDRQQSNGSCVVAVVAAGCRPQQQADALL